MTLTSAQRLWLFTLFGAVLLIDYVLSPARGHELRVLGLLGPAALLATVYLALTRPGLAALVGALILMGSSFVWIGGAPAVWLGIRDMTLPELLAGSALVVLLAWRARADIAVLGIAALVVATLAAIGIREGRLINLTEGSNFVTVPGAFDLRTLVFGFFLLVVCVAGGTYLRLSGQQQVDSEQRTLIRRQWPLGAALAVLMLLDIGATGSLFLSSLDSPYMTMRLFVLASAVVAAVCAFLAPRAPTRYAFIAAGALGLVLVPLLPVRLSHPGSTLPSFTLTQAAASMALVAFVARQGRPQPAAWATLALFAVNSTVIVETGRGPWHDDYVLPLGFALVISVATGLYFRARDRERRQSVRVAVSGAQNAERLALARELHDVVAHHVTGIVVQAQAARLVATRDPTIAVNALEKIENSGTEALTAMRMLVGSLRGAEPAGGSTAATQATSDLAADIRALVEQFPGPTVHLELNLPEQLPHEMGRSVLRLLQESLTNISKHAAGATNVHLGVTTGQGDAGEELHVFVTDDGTARRSHPVGGSGGYGLVGMRERVELLGGFFSAGPGADGGWIVKVALPLRSKS